MKVLVFGHSGQIAQALIAQAGGVDVLTLGRDQVDLGTPDMIRAAIEATDANVIINAAAFTAVDAAETDSDTAEQLNNFAVGTIARAAAKRGLPFLHISTDYVFSGHGTHSWKPTDTTDPVNIYGATKRRGEQAVEMAGGPHAILRTSWVFSANGHNFVKSMLKLGQSHKQVSVVGDQIGGPTSAADIAAALLKIAKQFHMGHATSGIYHFAGHPACSWADFATEIFAQAGLDCAVTPILTSDYPRPATRPQNSRLDCSTTATTFDIQKPEWRKSLRSVLADLGVLE
mgnify:CR=1 FL=1